MAWVPLYNLDPHVAVRSPDQMPLLMQRGIHDVIEKETEGSLHDKFMRAFNFIAKSLTESGRLRRGTLDLTPLGIKREDEVRRLKDTKTKIYWLGRWAAKLREKDPTLYAKTWWQARDDQGGP
jgi:hypothetical protein